MFTSSNGQHKSSHRSWLCLPLWLCLSATALSQPVPNNLPEENSPALENGQESGERLPPAEPEPLFEEPWYQVELIVFAWPDRAPAPHHLNAGEPDLAGAVDPYPEGLPLPEGDALPDAEFNLDEPLALADEDTLIANPEQAANGDHDDGQQAGSDLADAGDPPLALPDELTDLFNEEPVEALPPPDPRQLLREAFEGYAWRPLAEDEYGLQAAWRRLQSDARTRPLIHLAWTQPEQALGEERRLRVRGGEIIETPGSAQGLSANSFIVAEVIEPEREIDGTVALSQGRYMHLDVSLFFRRLMQSNEVLPGSGIWRARTAQASSWVIEERRRVRPDQVHYFDHERFGVIALVRELEPQYDPALPFDPENMQPLLPSLETPPESPHGEQPAESSPSL